MDGKGNFNKYQIYFSQKNKSKDNFCLPAQTISKSLDEKCKNKIKLIKKLFC